jgi:antitoxin component of RelBE/YafQ-DinJ toxin-antitoxin module
MTYLQIRIKQELKDMALSLAKNFDISLSDIVRMSLAEFIRKRNTMANKNDHKKRVALVKKLSKGHRDTTFHKLSNEDIDRLISSY